MAIFNGDPTAPCYRCHVGRCATCPETECSRLAACLNMSHEHSGRLKNENERLRAEVEKLKAEVATREADCKRLDRGQSVHRDQLNKIMQVLKQHGYVSPLDACCPKTYAQHVEQFVKDIGVRKVLSENAELKSQVKGLETEVEHQQRCGEEIRKENERLAEELALANRFVETSQDQLFQITDALKERGHAKNGCWTYAENVIRFADGLIAKQQANANTNADLTVIHDQCHEVLDGRYDTATAAVEAMVNVVQWIRGVCDKATGEKHRSVVRAVDALIGKRKSSDGDDLAKIHDLCVKALGAKVAPESWSTLDYVIQLAGMYESSKSSHRKTCDSLFQAAADRDSAKDEVERLKSRVMDLTEEIGDKDRLASCLKRDLARIADRCNEKLGTNYAIGADAVDALVDRVTELEEKQSMVLTCEGPATKAKVFTADHIEKLVVEADANVGLIQANSVGLVEVYAGGEVTIDDSKIDQVNSNGNVKLVDSTITRCNS